MTKEKGAQHDKRHWVLTFGQNDREVGAQDDY